MLAGDQYLENSEAHNLRMTILYFVYFEKSSLKYGNNENNKDMSVLAEMFRAQSGPGYKGGAPKCPDFFSSPLPLLNN